MPSGQALEASKPPVTRDAAHHPEPLLEVSGLACSFGGVRAVVDTSFVVRQGTITGLIGPNGAGKSTVVNLVSGQLKPQSGRVRFDGKDLTGSAPYEMARRGIIRTFQTPNVFGRLTVFENLLVGGGPWSGESFGAAMLGKLRWRRGERELSRRVFEVLHRFGLERLANEPAGKLSGGQKRLVELMRALMARPKMLLLDEPTAGVAPALALSIADHLAELRDEGITMLMVEHELRIVERLCDPVIVMAQGVVLAEGTLQDLRKRQDVVDAYLGA